MRRNSTLHARQIDGVLGEVCREVEVFDLRFCCWAVWPSTDGVDEQGHASVAIQLPIFHVGWRHGKVFADLLKQQILCAFFADLIQWSVITRYE
jgi:hypothetical protein